MRKNIAGQIVSFQMNATADGAAVTTGTPAVYYTIDGGTQGTGAGTAAHEGNGQWSYAPAQAETNGNHVAWTMVLANAITQTVNTWPVSFDPTDSVRIGITALPNAAADAAGGLTISDLGGLDMDALNTAAVRLTAARAQVLDDWINAGRLDAILDLIAADVDGLNGAAMRGTDSAAVAGDAMTLTATATSAQLVDDVWDEATSGHITAGTYGKAVSDTLTDTNELQGDWTDGGRLDTLLDAIPTTPMRGTDGANTVVPDNAGIASNGSAIAALNDISAAEVNTEVDNALNTVLPTSPTADSINDVLNNIRPAAKTILDGTAITGTLSTTEMTTDIPVTVLDQLNGRQIIFADDTTTAALRGQATNITATTVTGSKLGFTALTTAPVNGDKFVIV